MHLWTNDNSFWKKLGMPQLEKFGEEEKAQGSLKILVNTAMVWGSYEKDCCNPMITLFCISTQNRKVFVLL